MSLIDVKTESFYHRCIENGTGGRVGTVVCLWKGEELVRKIVLHKINSTYIVEHKKFLGYD